MIKEDAQFLIKKIGVIGQFRRYRQFRRYGNRNIFFSYSMCFFVRTETNDSG